MTFAIHTGDCRELLRTMADRSVHCCVTSPPYFGLRDYGMPPVQWPEIEFSPFAGLPQLRISAVECCLGMEPDQWDFVGHMVSVFREVRRVLRDDGTLWLNLGDSYAGNGGAYGELSSTLQGSKQSGRMGAVRKEKRGEGIKSKDLIGIPWRVAFALQADGWYLRQDIIWSKPNPMPESVRDRCTKAHEYLFLLSKGPRYYFDQDAIAEHASGQIPGNVAPQSVPGERDGRNANLRNGLHEYANRQRSKRNSFARETKQSAGKHGQKPQHRPERDDVNYDGKRNKRSVWTVSTKPFKEAHFATFPPALIEPCILAGCPAGGVVLDPFGGAGTTAVVAERLGRDSLLLEMNPEYAAIAQRRLADVQPGLALGATA